MSVRVIEADLPAFRTAVSARPLLAYDKLDTVPRQVTAANDILARGSMVIHAVSPEALNIVPPVDFDLHNRSVAYRLHAWDPLSTLLAAYEVFREDRYLDASWRYAEDWISQHMPASLEESSIEESIVTTRTLAWYDMAVGQRIYRLAYLVDVLARTPRCSDQEFGKFWDALVFHFRLLSIRDFIKWHNNHGLYQVLGQIAAARRFEYIPSVAKYRSGASEWLAELIENNFFDSGAHREHSPGYQYMVLGSLLGARRSGILSDKEDKLLRNAETVLTWMINPLGTLAPIGDTDVRGVNPRLWEKSLTEAEPDSALSERVERVEPSGVLALPDAGYAFARIYADGVPPDQAAYLAQIAGFHSRTHKHADHLSMVWHDRGREILIDPGRFSYASAKPPMDSELFKQGFWYSDPRRIYVEKTRAHNCVEIDGRDYPRKGVKPFGSALLDAREEEGFVVTSCETRHFRTVRHWRGLVMKAGHFLLVLDWLQDKGQPHEFRQWFHFAPEWDVSTAGEGMRAVNGGEELRIVGLLPNGVFQPVVRGQTEPELLGWRSDKAESLVPSPCFSILQTGNTAAFATLLVFGNEAEPDAAFSKVNATFRKGRFGWRDAQGSHRLFFDRTSGEFHVTQKRGLTFW